MGRLATHCSTLVASACLAPCLLAVLIPSFVAAEPVETHSSEVAAEIERLQTKSLQLLIDRGDRLLRIGEPIRLHGADLCLRIGPVLGVAVTVEDEVPKALREVARKLLSLDDQVRVLSVLPGYPAQIAGLEVGDAIFTVDGQEIDEPEDLRRLHLLAEANAPERKTLEFSIERAGVGKTVLVPYWPGCAETADLAIADEVGAWAGNHGIFFTTGLMRVFESDAEIAFIAGHELAHVALRHRGGSRPRLEEDADYLGLYFSARAGYDIATAHKTQEQLSRLQPFGLRVHARMSHPSYPARVAAMKLTIAEIRAKIDAGQPLVPEAEQ